MLKRLERDATKADLAAVQSLLSGRTPEEDPVGHLQFSRRLDDLHQRLQEIEETPSRAAEVGLFFGGRPVVGSYGILAEFSAKALAEFQTLVSSAFAAQEGALGSRGPVPQRDRTQLLLTDVARGSFGFILHQAEDHPQFVDSAMKDVVSHAVDLVFRVASPDQEIFETLAEGIDSRVLGSLRSFFKVVDDAGATMRIVEDRREFTLQREDIGLARERTESVSFSETDGEVTGAIYILPIDRRFELHAAGGEALKGSIAPECLDQLTGGGTEVTPGIIGSVRTVRLRVRQIQARGQEPRRSYVLLSVGGTLTLLTR